MIKRRRLVALVSAIVLVVVGLVAVATGLVVTHTDFGREQQRRWIQAELASKIKGTVYVGELSGNILTGLVLDTLAIRDADNDSLLFSSGQITASYDPRDLADKRLLLRNVEIEHPTFYVRQHANGRWNFKEIFRGYEKKGGPRAPGRNFGDYVVIDTARIYDATFVLQLPWNPDDSLRGAKRDSAVKYNLTRPDKEIRRVVDGGKSGYARTWRWTHGNAVVSRVRLADPDSDNFGKLYVIDTLKVDESDPPFKFRDIRGTVRHLGDSIWVDVSHFDLPASTGGASGKIVWGSDLPVRYDVSVRGDSVSLKDVHWVYPTLPEKGGGSVMVHIGNERNLHIIDYKLTKMDVRSEGSHLVGDMTFGVGGPVLVVKDVVLSAQPVDFDLLRTLSGKPFPVDWRGQLYGSVRARGGPLTNFVVDESEAIFRDAHVPGAASRVSGKGELDILRPAFTNFHGFAVNAASVDLRSIEYLYPNFPRLGGTVSGVATLDSSWLDVRFSKADVAHRDGPGDPSRVTGSGRVTWGEQFMTYDVDLQAQPLSLGTLARSYPKLPLTGTMTGPIRAKGSVSDLQLAANLQGPAGGITYDGKVDVYPPGYTARGSGQLTSLALQGVLDPARVKGGVVRPATITGRYELAISGDSLANLDGAVALDVSRADVEGARLFPSRARLRFADKRLLVDTLRVESTAGTINARGSLGLARGVATSDSLLFELALDSLGGVRRYLESSVAREGEAADSLVGSVRATGVARGRLDSLDLAGTFSGAKLQVGTTAGRRVSGRFQLRDVLGSPSGSLSMRGDSLLVAGVRLDSASGWMQLAGQSKTTFGVVGYSRNGAVGRVSGSALNTMAVGESGREITQLALDTLSLDVGKNRWRLVSPARLTRDSTGLGVQSLELTNSAGGRLSVRGAAPMNAPVSLELRGDSVPLNDVSALAQFGTTVAGFGSFDVRVTGTRAKPEITFKAESKNLAVGSFRAERVSGSGSYRDRKLSGSLDLYRGAQPELRATAELPIELTLFRARKLEEPLRMSIRADSADLSLIQMLSRDLQNISGKFATNLDVGGTWKRLTYGGTVSVTNGDFRIRSLNIVMRDVNGTMQLDAARDSLRGSFRAWSGDGTSQRIAVNGGIRYADRRNPIFDVTLYARGFRAMNIPTLATVDVSTGSDSLRFTGSLRYPSLAGTVIVDRGAIYLPERDLARKQVIELRGEEVASIADVNAGFNQAASSDVVRRLRLGGVRVNFGEDVWLRTRSNATKIKLGGSLNVTNAYDADTIVAGTRPRTGLGDWPFALEGQLNASRGYYTLDLSPAPVRREFQVQRGTLTFYGTPDNNPYADITASYNLKRKSQSDLTVTVHVIGALIPNPSIELSSNENWLSTSDLISYLVTGQPKYALNSQDQRAVQQASSVLFPTLTALGAEQLRSFVGSAVDNLQFQGGTSVLSDSGTIKSYFLGARLGAEKQIANNLFVSLSTGLCSLNKDYLNDYNNNALVGLISTVGGKIEYRFTPQLSLQALTDPPTSAMYCGRQSGLPLSIIQTPRQYGFSLLRSWHF